MKNNQFLGGLALVVITIYLATQLGFNLYHESLRVKCNRAILAEGKLTETVNNSKFTLWSSRVETVEDVHTLLEGTNALLEITNKEVNDMRTLIGCYFDKI